MSHEHRKRGGPPTAAQQELDNFWTKVMEDIRKLTANDLKAQADLPLARIKKIMKLDEDVKMISAEAPVVFARAAEIFIYELTLRAWIQAEEGKRRTLQRSDIAQAISKCDQFDFLIDIVPREEVKPTKPPQSENKPVSTQVSQDQPQMFYNVQVGPDGSIITQPHVPTHPQLMPFQGLPGFGTSSLGQQALQPIQIVGPNGQLQTVAILGGAAIGLHQSDQGGDAQRQIQIPGGVQLMSHGGAAQVLQVQAPIPTSRQQATATTQTNAATNTSPQNVAAAGQIQIIQQVIGQNGEVQNIPVNISPSQLQALRSQMPNLPGSPSVVTSSGSHQMVQIQQLTASGVGGQPVFISQTHAQTNGNP